MRNLTTTHLISMPRLAEVEQRLAVAQETLRQGEPDGVADELGCVGEAIAEIDEEITVALGEIECQRRAVDAVTDALASMGYDVATAPGSDVVRATSGSGRVAEVEITDSGDGLTCVSTFIDSDHAVPSDDAAAGELCDPAVEDQLAFQKLMQAEPNLAFGKPQAVGRPVRGSQAAGSTKPARRWQRIPVPRQRRAR
ncbi:MAG: hypothetical protein Q8K63_06725 [Acidimicrobiales bacterium]|nr:hypothetical protein [Acidimicrobiales bacterium]